jgi:hypothetical protein
MYFSFYVAEINTIEFGFKDLLLVVHRATQRVEVAQLNF